ncbi:MAG: hypothetical protein ACI3ZB_05940 [Prevotella sp.]
MSWLKDGFGSSDEELFEKCESDLLTRQARPKGAEALSPGLCASALTARAA